MSKGYSYTAYIVKTRTELENAVENKKHVIICRGELYNELKESGFTDKIKKYVNGKKRTTALGIGATLLGGPVGLIALGGAAISGGKAYSDGKKDDLKKFKEYKNISLDILKEEIVFFYKDYNHKHDTYHE